MHSNYSHFFLEFSKEAQNLDKILKETYPILKLDFFLAVLSLFSFYSFLVFGNHPDFYVLNSFLLLVTLSFLLVRIYYVYCSLLDPIVSSHLNLTKSVRLYGFRSFGTLKTVGHICRLCVKGGLGFGLGLEIYPKLVDNDFDSRGILVNFLSLHTGYKIQAAKGFTMRKATIFLEYFPDDKHLIVNSDGVTVNPKTLDDLLKARGIIVQPFFSAQVIYNHQLPFPSWKK